MSNNTAFLKSDLEADLDNGFQSQKEKNVNTGNCFNIKPINDWINEAKNRPIPNMLFNELWYESEISILFADTNLGKSILGLQISNMITKGISVNGFRVEVTAQKVLYCDFELSDKQVENRYSNQYSEHYIFSPNLLRLEINPEQETPTQFKDFEEYLCLSLENAIVEYEVKIVVIDNLTYLKTDTEKAKDALPLMKFLNGLKKKYGLSILVLAHTPKRDASKPLTKNDLSGSKMLMNFCDSCFAIGESAQETGLRYIKQIKQRNTELIYDTNNLIVCKIEKESNFLEFVFVGFENELDHLKPRNNEEQLSEILELKKQGLPNTKIASTLGISEGTVRNKMKKSENL
ncbi:MAG: AAA family ATPase [Methylotenera sp.]|nr:AAA family ATPase [Flavobacterium sp.]